MKNNQRGFVLFSVMLIITMIVLFSLMLLQSDTENSRLTRISTQISIETIKARTWFQAISDYSGCDVQALSPDALLHADEHWWQTQACHTKDNAWLVSEPPVVSQSSIIATQIGWVAAQYRRVTLRYQTANMPAILMQALVAEPSTVKVAGVTGKTRVEPGTQQLACLSD